MHVLLYIIFRIKDSVKPLFPKTFPAFNKLFAYHWKLGYNTILEGLLKLIIPAGILLYTNLSIYKLIGKGSSMIEVGNPPEEKRVFTLIAIVGLFIACNSLKFVTNVYDIAIYQRIMACQSFNPNMYFGYTNSNITVSILGRKTQEQIPKIHTSNVSAKFFLLFNSCSNFLIYVACSPKFRRLLKREMGRVFTKKRRQKEQVLMELVERNIIPSPVYSVTV